MDPVSAARRLPNHFHTTKKILGLGFALQRYRDKPRHRVSCIPTVKSFGPRKNADVHQLWPWLPVTKSI